MQTKVYDSAGSDARARASDRSPSVHGGGGGVGPDVSEHAAAVPGRERLDEPRRTVELDPTVDTDPRARYFQQATNGLYVRMALLTLLWDE